jgi:hypothetical protein
MVKLLVKLALTALVANAVWRLGSAYLQFYRFSDAVSQVVQSAPMNSRDDLDRRVIDLASQYDIPLSSGDITVKQDERNHTTVEGAYTKPIDFAPGYQYPWPFALHVDVLNPGTPPPAPGR